jgi:transcriptional regulator with XRE-family HTH domain
MDRGVGTFLQEARNRRKIDLSEVEAATRIRLRYLSAIENEEWDVLPGGVYTRGFIRTYASFLGLDGDRLVEEYREGVERWNRAQDEQVRSPGRAGAGGASGGRTGAAMAALAVLAVIGVAAVAVLAIPDGDGGRGGGAGRGSAPAAAPRTAGSGTVSPQPRPKPGISVRLAARAEVWVCVLNARGQAVVDGQILQAGAEEGPFRSGSFTVSFGNGEVEMQIDGREAEIPATSSPIGYAVDPSGELTRLDEAERPSCA